ncbi:type IV conjugative transfer system protein TraL [Helicobacter pullorum MIT 98-5489]|uniref:Type IV conjugative transfer system protein TraL n=2 Tax=Helicobacter pullorum TaxID=35818 RepID=C5F069_9HELI|nr:type IV conjugative transfer system protein TraL [Helicobacter pullorum]EAI5592854.1 type IV conjugative transfer system protein TraL [Campylobacter jejuni]HEH5010475.1 type IV conjugative transfer system protein TraL [Campylobacter coli]EAL0720601.1 type IV conjugative transfer system protein TraL [Campylobacter jejuni]EEQ63663.1 type IV conjugative transfer system protein TraL [Helicobacter pullorum MIT 98-5489]KPH55491.1 pilus assembly protein [Helicobacter pullorum]
MAKNESGLVVINKFIDQKPMVGNWEMDVVVVFIGFCYVGFFIPQSFVVSIVIVLMGIVATMILNKLKKAKVKGFFLHILYMLGLRKPKTYPPSYMRYFLGG